MLKDTMKHSSLYEHLKIIGESTLKRCKFKIRYFDNKDKIYRAPGFLHDEEKFKTNIEMGIVSTPSTTTST